MYPESTKAEEEEVLERIRGCLDLREAYIYREKDAPWEKVTELGSTVLDSNRDPFHFDLVEATSVSFCLLACNCLAAIRIYVILQQSSEISHFSFKLPFNAVSSDFQAASL